MKSYMRSLKDLEKNLIPFMNLGRILICRSWITWLKEFFFFFFNFILQLIGRCRSSLFIFFMPMTKTNRYSLLGIKP